MKTAILVDGAFYRKRASRVFGDKSPEDRAEELYKYCTRHLTERTTIHHDLYRIFYYDCPPMMKTVFHPLRKSNRSMKNSPNSVWMSRFLECLRERRKVALRLGFVDEEHAAFNLKADVTKKLFTGKCTIEDITESDFAFSARQKGVDMKIGLDISSMAYKKQVNQLILISGDSDFVPAAKLARREGVDFILDPLGHHIKADLKEHIDGLRTCDNRFKK